MRWIVGLLAIANVAVFAWQRWYPHPPPQRPVAAAEPVSPSAARLALLREVDMGELRLRPIEDGRPRTARDGDGVVLEPASPPAKRRVEAATATPALALARKMNPPSAELVGSPANPAPKRQVEKGPRPPAEAQLPEVPSAQRATPGQPAPKAAQVAPATRAQTPSSQAARRVAPGSEQSANTTAGSPARAESAGQAAPRRADSGSQAQKGAALTTPAGTPAKRAATRTCYSVGPLEDLSDVRRVGQWFAQRGAERVLRQGERRELEQYWVYFPPFASRDEAVQRVETLREQGIEDVSVLRKGDMANAVSLGMYNRRHSLQKRLKQLQAKGYRATVAPRYRTLKASWFDVSSAQPVVVSEFGKSFAEVEIREESCGRQH